MKELMHNVIVSNDYEYLFSNADLSSESPEDGNARNSGIKMVIEECRNPEKFFSCFHYEVCDEENPDFQENWQAALRGESTFWKLTATKISHRYMWMTFQNEELYRIHNKGVQEVGAPYYLENVVFVWEGTSGEYAKLRFELEHPDDVNPEAIRTYFSTTAYTQITELAFDKHRTLYLPGRKVPALGDMYCLIDVMEHYR